MPSDVLAQIGESRGGIKSLAVVNDLSNFRVLRNLQIVQGFDECMEEHFMLVLYKVVVGVRADLALNLGVAVASLGTKLTSTKVLPDLAIE